MCGGAFLFSYRAHHPCGLNLGRSSALLPSAWLASKDGISPLHFNRWDSLALDILVSAVEIHRYSLQVVLDSTPGSAWEIVVRPFTTYVIRLSLRPDRKILFLLPRIGWWSHSSYSTILEQLHIRERRVGGMKNRLAIRLPCNHLIDGDKPS